VVAPDDTAISAVLARQAEAVRTRDRAAFLATIDPAAKSYRTREGQVFDNLTKLPIQAWRPALDPVQPVQPTPSGDTMRISLRYRLAGFDTSDTVSTRYLTFVRNSGGAWLVEGDGSVAGMHDDTEIWDHGPISVVRGNDSLVIGDAQGAQAELTRISQRLDQAVPIVSSVVGTGWSRRVVALAPADDQELDGLVGGGDSVKDIAAMAAVSHGQDRIMIAPDSFGRLNALGLHVVLTHETTHIATGAAHDSRTPTWLIEGLADYVGYKDTSAPTATAAKELQTDLAAGRAPAALPAPDQFGGGSTALPQAYEEAWLACRMIAERYGEPALMRLYHAAGHEDQDTAIQSTLDLTTRQLTAQWIAYLHQQLG
jgi:hypothetical protein